MASPAVKTPVVPPPLPVPNVAPPPLPLAEVSPDGGEDSDFCYDCGTATYGVGQSSHLVDGHWYCGTCTAKRR